MKKKLKLILTRKWFDMILSGEKKEEYRDIKESTISLLFNWKESGLTRKEFTYKLKYEDYGDRMFNKYLKYFDDNMTFYHAYSHDRDTFDIEFLSIKIGDAIPEWSDNWQGKVFVIELGEIVKNI